MLLHLSLPECPQASEVKPSISTSVSLHNLSLNRGGHLSPCVLSPVSSPKELSPAERKRERELELEREREREAPYCGGEERGIESGPMLWRRGERYIYSVFNVLPTGRKGGKGGKEGRRDRRIDSLLDVLPTGNRIPHTSSSEPLDVFDDNEGFLLQSYDGQMVVVRLRVAERVEARPHVVFQRQATVVQTTHLETHRDTGLHG